MCHHNHGLVLTTTESFYHIFHQLAVVQVQPMQRLIQNKQLRILHKARANNTRRCSPLDNCKKFRSFKSAIPKYPSTIHKPPSARDADVCTTPQNHVVRLPQYLWQEGFQISAMHLRTDISYMLLYLPNTFSGTAFSAEQGNITSITLRIIRTDQTQQRRLS